MSLLEPDGQELLNVDDPDELAQQVVDRQRIHRIRFTRPSENK